MPEKPKTHEALLVEACPLPFVVERYAVHEPLRLIAPSPNDEGWRWLVAKSSSKLAEDKANFELIARWSRAIPQVLELLKKLDDINEAYPGGRAAKDWLDNDGTLSCAYAVQDCLDGHDG